MSSVRVLVGTRKGAFVLTSDAGRKTWETGRNQFLYEGAVGPHVWYDGSPHPYEFKRVWHLEPSLKDPDMLYAGAEDAALFASSDAGQSWSELPGLRTHPTASGWAPGAGGLCLHTILLDPTEN